MSKVAKIPEGLFEIEHTLRIFQPTVEEQLAESETPRRYSGVTELGTPFERDEDMIVKRCHTALPMTAAQPRATDQGVITNPGTGCGADYWTQDRVLKAKPVPNGIAPAGSTVTFGGPTTSNTVITNPGTGSGADYWTQDRILKAKPVPNGIPTTGGL